MLVDVINDLDFPQGRQLLRHALPAAKRLARLKRRAKNAGVPVIYVNDNFGRWQSDFRAQVEHCAHEDSLGREMTLLLAPEKDDYFVLKPKHSGFYSTTLEVLLQHLKVKELIIGGVAANLCVLYTANDAYMRDYSLVIPRDGVAAETTAANNAALDHMKKALKARVVASDAIRFHGRGLNL